MPLTKEQKDRWGEAFKEADKDGSGQLSTKELRDLFLKISDGGFSEEEFKELMNEVDKNKDGSVNFEQFCIMMDELFD